METFEKAKVVAGSAKHRELLKIAAKIADFATRNLDRTRFAWIADRSIDIPIVHHYAKNWTCSLAADQNAQTRYRNWRKELQEEAVLRELISRGYVRSEFVGVVTKDTDIAIGEYTKEIKVRGRTTQKADLVFRSKKSRKLVLLEAKAVGVEVDATKRIKECCDKANDWVSSTNLNAPVVVAIIAGFFTETNISNLRASGVSVVWEHRLSDIEAFE